MNTKTKSLSISTMLSAVLLLTLSASQASVQTTRSAQGGTVTRIRVNGLGADVLLSDGNTNGYLLASRDQLTNTSALDFSYAFPHETDPDLVVLLSGAGAIPNSAFTTSQTTAHLSVTTTFPITRCVINLISGDYTCGETTARTFDLSWTRNGFSTQYERTQRLTTFGPVTTRFHGAFSILSATISGNFDGHEASVNSGNLLDSQSNSVTREITLEPNP